MSCNGVFARQKVKIKRKHFGIASSCLNFKANSDSTPSQDERKVCLEANSREANKFSLRATAARYSSRLHMSCNGRFGLRMSDQ